MAREPIAEALRRSRRDPDAFAGFYAAHAEALLAHVTRRVYDVDTASDLVAESFARAYLKRRSFRGRTDAEAGAWLYAIAARETAQFVRRNVIEKRALRRLGLSAPRLTPGEEERILELAGLDELRATVRVELGRLTETQREALRLRVVDELPYEQVAAQLGVSQQTARARVARGLRALAEALDRQRPLLEEEPA